jgi:hypothetical protein
VHSSEIDRSTNRFVDTFGLKNGMGDYTPSQRERQTGGPAFFRKHYRKHSQQLVDALLSWIDQLRFTTCEYKDGELREYTPDSIEPEYVAYMEEMKAHLEKAYSALLLPTPAEIESEHSKIYDDIKSVISSTSVVPGKPSYEWIIIDKMKQCCQTLKRRQHLITEENNIYLDRYIFGMIFETVTREDTMLDLDIKPGSNKSKVLIYDRIIIAKGEEKAMINLKNALEELLVDKSISYRASGSISTIYQ